MTNPLMNIIEVDRMLSRVDKWIGTAKVSTVEQGEIARAVLQLGGQRAVITADRIMNAEMSEEDWKVVYDAYQEVVRLIGLQLVTVAPAELEGKTGDDEA